jgi:hypothetical protein
MRVDIGIACNKNQEKEWWARVVPELLRVAAEGRVELGQFIAIGSALTDAIGSALTDHNRNHIVGHFLEGEGEAIWWIDDDVVPPAGTLEALVGLDVEIAAGVYFLRKPPCNPVVYARREDGFYRPLWEYQQGEIIRADSVGMGCTLIRRCVYERIQEQYVLFRRVRNGTVVLVHREDVVETRKVARQVRRQAGKVLRRQGGRGAGEQGSGGAEERGRAYLLEELVGPVEAPDVWPFYALEYGRTEDHFFCEMARRVGFEIVVDTGIECQHWGCQPVTGKSFREMRERHREQGPGTGDEGQEVGSKE